MNDQLIQQAQQQRWALGCEHCHHGIRHAPPLTGVVSLYMERIVQMVDGEIDFCTCKAGSRYKAALLNRNQELIEEAKQMPKMAWAVNLGSHPEIIGARRYMLAAIGQPVDEPTIRYEGAA